MHDYDAIIIGTGQAGPALAARLSQAGMQLAVIERKFFGGTCVNTGCIPTKALVASAYAAHMARRAADFGVTIRGEIAVDMAGVKARKDDISGKSRAGVESWVRGLPGCTVIQGHARFSGPHSVAVGGTMLRAGRIFINVGGRAAAPPIPGLERTPYLTNSGMMELGELPDHLVIIGGSYIGLEFAQMYRRFGSRVSVVEMAPRIIPREDEDISAAVADILESEGVALHTGAECIRVSGQTGSIAVTLRRADTAREIAGSHLLIATGRRPNTDDLGLEAAGIETDERGYIKVDDQLRTNVEGVWALGDCNGRGAFTHTAYNDFEIVAANLLDGNPRRVGDRIPAYCLYTDPPLGRVGMTEAEARRTGKPYLVARRPMTRVGRAVEKGEALGFMKILVDAADRRILGAALLGVGCDEVVHAILTLMYAGAPCDVMQRAMHIHPTVSELLPTMLGELVPPDVA